ncbi:hypothetical protein AVEN_111382-1 [Araneus ventricosus]|uniref:Uncharacterized protein n=1 Tax=Araneus ventricosus TaxID=182803 RepID=A0A4Y2G3Y4_ARAVE|nr:hypothetical protein AVEN_111382-1 [Araneus ventricosus]
MPSRITLATPYWIEKVCTKRSLSPSPNDKGKPAPVAADKRAGEIGLYLSVSQADMDADDKSYLINWFHRFLSFIFYVLGNRNFLRCLPHKSNFRFLICAIRAYSADLRVDIESRTRVRVIEPSRPLLFECLRNMPDGPLGRVFLHKKITFGHPTPSGEMESSCVSLECADSKLFVGCFLNKICPSFRRTSFSFIEGYLRR